MTSPTRALFSWEPNEAEAMAALKKIVENQRTDRLKRAKVYRIFHELMESIPKAKHGESK